MFAAIAGSGSEQAQPSESRVFQHGHFAATRATDRQTIEKLCKSVQFRTFLNY
jgi:hypothetical protein